MVEVYKKLKNAFNLKIFDPIVKQKDFWKVIGEKVDYSSLEECFEDTDIIVLGCAHKGITHKDILKHLNNMNNKFIIVDGRGGYPELRKMLPKENYIKI